MNNNRVMGEGSVLIADAIAQSETIQVFDISFNSVCNNPKVDFPPMQISEETKQDSKKPKQTKNEDMAVVIGKNLFTDYAGQWSNMFLKNESLLHVDLSFNNINESDCNTIAQGLKGNHKILGLHFQGN